MRIKCWGARGSFPVSGPEYARYGGDTCCVEVESSAGDIVLLDAGTGIRSFNKFSATVSEKPIHLVFSHFHLDHIIGFTGFSPIFKKNTTLHIYDNPFLPDSTENALRNIMRAPYFPVDFNELQASITFHKIGLDESFTVGALKFTPICLNHPGGGSGYRIEENGKTFVFLTDNELEYGNPKFNAEYFETLCEKADLLIHDGAYTDEEYPRYKSWGHSKYTDTIRLALASNAKRLGIFHLDAPRTDSQMDAIVEDAKKIISEKGSNIECHGIGAGFEITI
ncbi:MAG: MBL fold metallo-hydrolase [Chitinispirillales bacterium]|jgi:phosphoribosyl 1,2-cyclic phosphodiesterase|nr:MBL fold metallo-hydrolase [Chitinispirillales bacterium]